MRLGFYGALTLLLIVLKLTGVIALSWWVVLLGPFALGFILWLLLFLGLAYWLR